MSVAFDVFPVLSFATALTSVPSFTLSAGITIFPSSTFNPLSAGLNVQVPSSPFVAVTFTGFVCPSGVYVTSTSFVSTSVGGVTVTSPLSLASTFGATGACVSLAFVLASSDALSFSSLAFAFTSESFLILSAGIIISPVFSSIVIALSVSVGSFHLPDSFVAFNVVSVSLPFGV